MEENIVYYVNVTFPVLHARKLIEKICRSSWYFKMCYMLFACKHIHICIFIVIYIYICYLLYKYCILKCYMLYICIYTYTFIYTTLYILYKGNSILEKFNNDYSDKLQLTAGDVITELGSIVPLYICMYGGMYLCTCNNCVYM